MEAADVRKAIECADRAEHDFEVEVVNDMDPVRVICTHCGATWVVAQRIDSRSPWQPWDDPG